MHRVHVNSSYLLDVHEPSEQHAAHIAKFADYIGEQIIFSATQ